MWVSNNIMGSPAGGVWLQMKHLFGTLGPSQSKAETTINDGSSISALGQDPGWALSP